LSLVRLSPLLAASGLGTLVVLLIARGLLAQIPRPTPDTPPALLALQQRWALDPERRREAALLRAAAAGPDADRRQRLLAGQGWGRGPVAAMVLKQQGLWQPLLRRLPHEPASADALYALGQQRPGLRGTLLRRWPAHPAALAAAVEQPGVAAALHLARYGARWPGAQARISGACRQANPDQRQQLAQGLAGIGALGDARTCLGGLPAQPPTALLLADGDPAQLQGLIVRHPRSPAAEQALRQLADDPSPEAGSALAALPSAWRDHPAVRAAAALRAPGIDAALAVVQRWPSDPASWELQWQRARREILAGRWQAAQQLLAAGGPRLERTLPVALEARRRFWLGLSAAQLGHTQQAQTHWRQLLHQHPGGYYGWRAATRLGLVSDGAQQAQGTPRWSPLHSGDDRVDRLWGLGQPLEAWEVWRTARLGQPPRGSKALQAEGRLREAIGDGWAGLGQQELAALRLPPAQCRLQRLIDTNLYRPRQLPVLAAAARQAQVPLSLLLGVAKQESRFQSAVRSVVGAAGLLQLMPETAAELAGRPLSDAELDDPGRNALLGGRYLRQLLQRWNGDALLAVASYNAGPNAVAGWLPNGSPGLPEVWVEAIPYPETRHYVKTVLGNTWSFAAARTPACS
jgi:soluble lytic murein transglycosylase